MVRRNTNHLDTLWSPGHKRRVDLCSASHRGLRGVAVGLILALGACATGMPPCRVGTDCPSGICGSDGVCEHPRDVGRLETDGGTPETDGGGTDLDGGMPPDAPSLACAPDHDGIVTRAEVPLRPGLRATFRVATDVDVSTSGTTWDYAGAYAGDHDELVELLSPAGTWWSGDFPTATHAARLSTGSENLGVFQITDDALLLLGVVSPDAGPTQTNLAYEPPVAVLRFPLMNGSTFSTTSTVTGQALGVFGFYTEEYTSVVDAAGTLVTPFGSIDALRVRTQMTRTSGLATLTSLRQFAFVGECFGIAGLVVSDAFETEAEFTHAAEMRRLAP